MLQKGEFLCVENYHEPYFDFECLDEVPETGSWYPVCGTAFLNRAEVIVFVGSFCLLGISFATYLLRKTRLSSELPTKKTV